MTKPFFCFIKYYMLDNIPKNTPYVTRFAPSPTGYLHLGHAYSALFTYDYAIKSDGRFILRLEDIDETRCKKEYEQAIFDDLAWLGIQWETPVLRQSEHFDDYKAALQTLDDLGLIYPCFCSRKDIREAASAPHGPSGHVYPGTCKHLSKTEIDDKKRQSLYSLRFHIDKAYDLASKELTWIDQGKNVQTVTRDLLVNTIGDVILSRKETPSSYHLSVVVDDQRQGITLVTRGMDLFWATPLHCLLQALLKFNTPTYHHHDLLIGDDGIRLAKRHQSITLRYYREDSGKSPEDIKQMILNYRRGESL